MELRPTLLHSCARAATAAEARYRIDYPNSKTRASRIVALDSEAASVIESISKLSWNGARFFVYKETTSRGNGQQPDALLQSYDGSETRLSDELEGADVAVMVATADRETEAAAIIGQACFMRGIMTAGLVVGDHDGMDDAVTALRPYASVLVIAADEDYVPEMLTALRA